MTDLELEEKIKKRGDVVQADADFFYDLLTDMSLIVQITEKMCFVDEVKEENEKAGAGFQRACNNVSEFISFYLRTQENLEK